LKLSFSVTGARALGVALVATALLPVRSPAQILEEALDSPPGWTWTTTATTWDGTPVPGGVWAGQTAVTHDGVDAARSGVTPLYGTSRLRTDSIMGQGTVTVTFWRRHGLAYEQNPSQVLANGNSVGPFLPGGVWQPVAIDFPPGPASLELVWYNTDQTGTAADNHLYVDEMVFAPTTGAPQFLPDPVPNVIVGEGYTVQPPVAVTGEKPMRLELTLPGTTFAYSTELTPRAAGMPPAFAGWPSAFAAHPDLTGLWTLTASNAAGVVTRTFNVTVVPAGPHSISIDGPAQVWAGATLRLTANPRGTAPFAYQWKKDGTPLTGETNQTLEITGFSAADEGNYTVEVTNALGSRESGVHSIVLGNDPPTLVSQSGNVDQALFGFDSLSVQVTGTPPFDTEWRKDGQVIESNNAAPDGSGWRYLSGDPSDTPGVYVFRSANGLGEVVSAPMVVQVGEGIGIADGLDNTNVGWRYPYTGFPGWHRQTTETHDGTDAVALLNSDPTPLRTAVEGPALVSFWWRVQDGDLNFSVDGTVEATLSSPGGDSGWQQVNVSVGTGWHELEWQTQSLTPAAWLDQFTALGGSGGPVIVSQPQGGNYSSGDTIILSVTVTGTGPFDYRLFRDDDPTPVQEALGQTATTYDFTLFTDFSTPGAYWIEITDAASRTAASDDAVISVDGDFGSLINLATAVGQPTLTWYYTDSSIWGGTSYPSIRPWYRTRQDGVAPGAESSARTPALDAGVMAAVVMGYDSGGPPTRLRFWARAVGANLAAVLFVGVNGTPATLTPAGTATGASGETWTAYDVMLGGGFSEVQFEALPAVNGVTVWLDRIEFTPAAPPVITQQPVPLTLPAGESGGLSVTATSPVPMTYQWFRLSVGPLPGETSDVLAFPALAMANQGNYYVEVRNEFGTTRSDIVGVTVTGPRPQITQPLQPQQLSPGDALSLEVAATSSNGPLTYRWYRNGALVQTGGTTFQRSNVTTADQGLYRVEVSDPYYTTSSQAQVTVSVLYYQLTVLPPVEAGGYAVAEAINNAGVVAGYWGSVGNVSALVWQNAVPTRMTPPGSRFNWSWSINNGGQVAGELGLDWDAQRGVVRWSPPYTTGVFDNLGYPAGATLTESRINDAGVIAATDFVGFGEPCFAYRYTTAGVWELLGSLTGVTPLRGAVDRGWATALDINNAGVIVGHTYFLEAGLTETNNIVTQATGWFFDPARPGQRTAMDTLSPELALSPTQPWGWIDSVNDLGEMAARRYGASSPTKLFLIQADGTVTKLLERPPRSAVPDGESFNVDALNNRREMVGYYHIPDGQRAALIRSRSTPPGGTPSALSDFELYDLNDLVLGGTGGYVLRLANDINDQGQIVGDMSRPGENSVGFLLTPVTPYTGMAALAVDDVVVRRPGRSIRFSGASLIRNDQGAPPLSLVSVAATSAGGGVIFGPFGGGWYRYTPPAGPDAPDTFTYVVRAGDGSTDTGTVRVLIEAEPPPAANLLSILLLPNGQVRVLFVGIPGRTYHIELASAVEGPWTRVATVVAGPTGLVEYQETPPPGGSRFYRMVE
jgi:hypothetical protein